MIAHLPASGKHGFDVGIILPYNGQQDDRLVNFAGLELAKLFGAAQARWDHFTETVVVESRTPLLSELEKSKLMQIGLHIAETHAVGVFIDDALFML